MADLPIALRRTRRSTSSLSTAFHGSPASAGMPTPPLTPSASSPSSAGSGPSTPSSRKTPSRRRVPQSRKRNTTSKRVRFSDPGQLAPSTPSTPTNCNCSSGLTPFIRRTSLQTGLPVSGDVSFLPLRQVLDGRVQRRLRRNGLSEEMNNAYAEKAEKTKRAKAAEEELARLRQEVAEKDDLISRLEGGDPDMTIMQDNDRVMALQREVNMLRRQLAAPTTDDPSTVEVDARTHNWTMAARDPFASTMSIDYGGGDYAGGDDDMTEAMTDVDDAADCGRPNTPDILDVDGNDLFGDATMAELQCSTPTRVRRYSSTTKTAGCGDSQMTVSFAQSSFPTPPATSPVAWADDADVGVVAPMTPSSTSPATPVTPSMHLFSTRRVAFSPVSSPPLPPPPPPPARMVDTEVQATLADPKTEELREQVTDLLRNLADKTAALEVLSKGLRGLSPQEESDTPVDASDIVARLASAFRTARLELEYLTPGEIELPLTAPAAAVLDLLLTRLRSLSQQVQQADAQVDEYHALEGDLRQQLGARVQAMDEMRAEGAAQAATIKEKEATITTHEATIASQSATISDLNIAADRFKGALASYARDVAELEALVGRLEADLKEKESVVERVTAEAADWKQTSDAVRKAARAAAATHGQALALRDARVHELRGEIEERDSALRAAQRRGHESARQLREDNAALQARLEAETQRATAAKAAVATLQVLLDGPTNSTDGEAASENNKKQKRLSLGRRIFGRRSGSLGVSSDGADATSASSTSSEGTSPSEPRSTKKRRRYDSGLGFLDEEEAETV
ncbi:hypothetical protein Sste5346_002254 [Sporothrix stenoceras]|uniref:Uncharacterized protein n=1 Tax=Sporothrix stenoceras TaxID=5173 RepID=A0ABR3ZIP8_9PEZI